MIPKLLVTAALMAANMAMTMTRKIEGPRLDDLKFTSGDYGAPLAMVWGTRRLQCPIFWAEDLKEIKRRRKTKGGKYNEYTYYGTWAVALAGHEIADVTRIWFDTHLVYDMTGAGPVTPFDFGKRAGSIDQYLAIYLGTETQDADPRMEATVEAAQGVGSCPAYRGTAYLVFKDLPLEKLGNRIPQVSVEFTSLTADAFPYTTTATLTGQASRLWNATFSNDFSRFLWSDGNEYEIWDVAAQSRMVAGTLPAGVSSINVTSRLGMKEDGTFLAVTGDNDYLYSFSADGATATLVQALAYDQQEVRVVKDGSGTEHWFTIPWSIVDEFYIDGTVYTMAALTGVSWTPYEYFLKEDDGSIWAVGHDIASGQTTAYFARVMGTGDGPGFISVAGLSALVGITLSNCTACYHDGVFILAWLNSDDLYRIDPLDGTKLTSRTSGISFDTYNAAKQFANLPPGSSSIWLNFAEISLDDLTTIRTVDRTDWLGQDADGVIYNPINHSLYCFPQYTQVLTERFLDRIGGNGVTLQTICEDVSDWCAVAEYDFSDLTQTISGWSATRGQASNMLEPLLDTHDSDFRPHDFEIQGIRRTGTSTGTLATARFVAQEPRYTVKLRQAAELPVAVLVNFADSDADQQPNTVRSSRPLATSDARGERALDMTTLVLTPDTARGLGDRHFRRLWNERKEVSLALTAQEMKLEPGDIRTLTLDDDSLTARCVKLTVRADGVLASEWKYDHPSLAGLDAAPGAAADGHTASSIAVPLLSRGFVLDIPYIDDSDAQTPPIVYLLAAPYASGTWPGAVFYQALDGEYSEELASVTTSATATWGYVATALAYTNPNLWDRGSSVTVVLQLGSLTGTTEAACDANPNINLAAYGAPGRWEIIQFASATLTATLTYALTSIKRGRRGTEWAAELHEANDVFVLLDEAQDEAMGLSEVGTDLSFKTVTQGRDIESSFPLPVSYTGASLMPYAPCQLRGVKDSGSGDWVLSWVRRTRVGGDWRGGVSIPLSEITEEYAVEIMNGSTVVRTVTGLSSATTTWTAAQQTTDFGSGQASVSFRVYQISADVDRGFMAAATA